MTTPIECPLCRDDGGRLLWQDDMLRVIAVDDADYPGFTRVVWHGHVVEMTDLPALHRHRLMNTVYQVEQIQRDCLAPDKINLAAFGNVVPHVHWHIIPRWHGDRHFPDPYWAAPRVVPGEESMDYTQALHARQARVAAYHQALIAALSETGDDR